MVKSRQEAALAVLSHFSSFMRGEDDDPYNAVWSMIRMARNEPALYRIRLLQYSLTTLAQMRRMDYEYQLLDLALHIVYELLEIPALPANARAHYEEERVALGHIIDGVERNNLARTAPGTEDELSRLAHIV